MNWVIVTGGAATRVARLPWMERTMTTMLSADAFRSLAGRLDSLVPMVSDDRMFGAVSAALREDLGLTMRMAYLTEMVEPGLLSFIREASGAARRLYQAVVKASRGPGRRDEEWLEVEADVGDLRELLGSLEDAAMMGDSD